MFYGWYKYRWYKEAPLGYNCLTGLTTVATAKLRHTARKPAQFGSEPAHFERIPEIAAQHTTYIRKSLR